MAGGNNKFNFSLILEKIKTNKILKCILVAILGAVLLIVIFSGTKKESQVEYDNEIIEYVYSLEDRLSKTLNKVSGAGDVKVVINIKSGVQTVLAMNTVKKETSNGVEIEETPLIVNGKTVVLKELLPEITGVLIVAQGADNIMVKSKLVNATKALLDIDSGKIEILTMK